LLATNPLGPKEKGTGMTYQKKEGTGKQGRPYLLLNASRLEKPLDTAGMRRTEDDSKTVKKKRQSGISWFAPHFYIGKSNHNRKTQSSETAPLVMVRGIWVALDGFAKREGGRERGTLG